jgi:hypothetical protein
MRLHAQEGRDKENNDTPSFSEFVPKRIETFTSSAFNVVREARTGRRVAEALAGPFAAFEVARCVALGGLAGSLAAFAVAELVALADSAESVLSFEAANVKAPADKPRLKAAYELAESSAVAVVAVARRPFAALPTGTAAIFHSLPPLVVSARNPLETKHKVCKRMRSAMARLVTNLELVGKLPMRVGERTKKSRQSLPLMLKVLLTMFLLMYAGIHPM